MVSGSDGLMDALKTFEYVKGSIYVHSDEKLQPRHKEEWGNVCYNTDPTLEYPTTPKHGKNKT